MEYIKKIYSVTCRKMISRQEQSCLKFIEKNIHILFFRGISAFAFMIRYSGLNFISGDMDIYLISWFGK